MNAANPAANDYLQQLHTLGAPATNAWALVNNVVSREALTLAVNDVFLLCAVMFFLMIPIIWIARPPFGNAGPGAAH